jgi:4-amino-4-deoxy-L-arabinose transferase-like glycosyltransferase
MAAALISRIKKLLTEHYSIIGILVGSALFAFTLGPFSNFDTNLEFQAASSVVTTGMPYQATGFLINQPPLAFYIDSVFLQMFGLSFNVGVTVVTFFSFGCTLLVYLIGREFYGKTTGVFASALFALTPWQLVFSRSFLIDVQCLFFSLFSLLTAVYAIRKDSMKIFMVSAVVFGLAFLTKWFAVFTLVPLALFYFQNRRPLLKRRFVPFLFFIPVAVFFFVWYNVILGCSVITAVSHDDFTHVNAAGLMPSPFFVGNFFVNTLGALFLAVIGFSLFVSLFERKLFRKTFAADLICLATVLVIAGVDTLMAVGLNLSAPFSSAIKYNYQALPYVCLIAASLLGKLHFNEKLKTERSWFVFAVCFVGVLLLVAAFSLNVYNAGFSLKADKVVFGVEGDLGYSFVNTVDPQVGVGAVYVQVLGFAFVISGLIWAVKNRLQTGLDQ